MRVFLLFGILSACSLPVPDYETTQGIPVYDPDGRSSAHVLSVLFDAIDREAVRVVPGYRGGAWPSDLTLMPDKFDCGGPEICSGAYWPYDDSMAVYWPLIGAPDARLGAYVLAHEFCHRIQDHLHMPVGHDPPFFGSEAVGLCYYLRAEAGLAYGMMGF